MEGIAIANFVADGYSTYLPQNAKCKSACAWIFMAGTNNATSGSTLSRIMNFRSTLAFHAPFVDL
jgi:hypothetical protein